MVDFRKITPARRSEVPEFSRHTEYKPYLREDFHQRCGYCGDHEFFRETYYEVDHFVPQKYLKQISPTDYTNLVYSCRSCNNFKRAKWPTRDENLPNNGLVGFIDPCDKAYPVQFYRDSTGIIFPKTHLGKWMWSALILGNPIHRLKWVLEQLRVILDELDTLEIESSIELKHIIEINSLYRKLEIQLKGKPNFE